MMQIDPQKPYKILLVQTGRIGDLILLLPVIEALKAQNSNYEIHVLASFHNYQAITKHPLVKQIHVYKKGVWQLAKLIAKLRNEKFDIWLDPKAHKSGESRMLAFFSGAKYKIGYEKQKFVFDYVLETDQLRPYEHIVLLNMLALKPFGIAAEVKRPRLYLIPEFEEQIIDFLSQNIDYQKIKKYYCVNLSGSNLSRSWQTEKWIEFLKAIPIPRPFIVIIASPKEKQRAEQIAAQLTDAAYLETKSITDVFGVVARAELVISPDTSIVHIAAAFDKPLLAFYVNLKYFYSKFYPLNSQFSLVMEEAEGAEVGDIPVSKVLEAYKNLQITS
jgi:ADP-heptose:LPS heptosyltransferase